MYSVKVNGAAPRVLLQGGWCVNPVRWDHQAKGGATRSGWEGKKGRTVPSGRGGGRECSR